MVGRYHGTGNGQGRFRAPLDVSDAIAAMGSAGSHLRSAVVQIERPDDPDVPVKVGPPSMVASPATGLARGRTFAWDVNGWYRALGISWPYVDATRRELREAGTALGADPDPQLHYGLRVLLGRIPGYGREHYDAMELGSRHIDPIEQNLNDADLKAKAAQGSATLAAEGIEKSPEEVLADMGFRQLDQEEFDALQRNENTTLSAVSGTHFAWGFWLQGTPDLIDYDLLKSWQAQVVRALNYLAPVLDWNLEGFAVGLGNRGREWNVIEIEREVVFMLDLDGRPTFETALQAARFALGDAALRRAVPRYHRRGER